MKTIKLIVEIEYEVNDVEKIKYFLKDVMNNQNINSKVYEYTEPVEELKPNRP